MTWKWPQLTDHDGGEAVRGVEGALPPAVLRPAGQREVSQVLKGAFKIEVSIRKVIFISAKGGSRHPPTK